MNKKHDTILRKTCVQQETSQNNGTKFPWKVLNEKGEELYELPKTISDRDLPIVHEFARHFEQLAYIQGSEEAHKHYKDEINNIKDLYEREMNRMRAENDRIATMLDQYLRADLEEHNEESKIGIPEYMR